MLDLKAWADDAPQYFARLRSVAIPNGVAQYGDEPTSDGKAASKPPISLGAWEAAEAEVMALWRVLSHYGQEGPFNPYMRAINRRVVGMKMCDDPEFVVSCMADDVIDCVDLMGPGQVSSRTVTFCHKVRSASVLIVGDLSAVAEDWVTGDEAREYEGVLRSTLYNWRSRGRVKFKIENGEFFYERDSLMAAHEKMMTRMVE